MRRKLSFMLMNITQVALSSRKPKAGASNLSEISLDSFLLVDPKFFSPEVDVLYKLLQGYSSAPILM